MFANVNKWIRFLRWSDWGRSFTSVDLPPSVVWTPRNGPRSSIGTPLCPILRVLVAAVPQRRPKGFWVCVAECQTVQGVLLPSVSLLYTSPVFGVPLLLLVCGSTMPIRGKGTPGWGTEGYSQVNAARRTGGSQKGPPSSGVPPFARAKAKGRGRRARGSAPPIATRSRPARLQ